MRWLRKNRKDLFDRVIEYFKGEYIYEFLSENCLKFQESTLDDETEQMLEDFENSELSVF